MYNLFNRKSENDFLLANRKIIKYCNRQLIHNKNYLRIQELNELLRRAKKQVQLITHEKKQKKQLNVFLLKDINIFNRKNKI